MSSTGRERLHRVDSGPSPGCVRADRLRRFWTLIGRRADQVMVSSSGFAFFSRFLVLRRRIWPTLLPTSSARTSSSTDGKLNYIHI
jgi:hypothetical protein